jgi:hypothetical protein
MRDVPIEKKPFTVVTCYDSIRGDLAPDPDVKLNLDTINIKGTVADESGEPYIGVTVTIQNSAKGTLTDMDGKFAIDALLADSLIFSFIGLLPQVIPVSEIKEDRLIVMKEDLDGIININNITCYIGTLKTIPDTINIKGTVTDKSKEPIAGVSVTIQNSTKGILTDVDGKFAINARPADSLVFSFIGFLPQTISVSELRENKAIIMEDDNQILCYEVVIVESPKRNPINIKPGKLKPVKTKQID